jgi:hypothetical protein
VAAGADREYAALIEFDGRSVGETKHGVGSASGAKMISIGEFFAGLELTIAGSGYAKSGAIY